jgi:hypothetical protein
MEIQKTSSGRTRLIISAVILIAPLYIQGLWIYISGLDNLQTQEDKSVFFNNHFPHFLQGNYPLVLIAFFSCSASLVLSALSLNKIGKLNWVAYIIIILSFLTGFLSLFQMM